MSNCMTATAEDQLLAKAKAGNSEAFSELVRINSSSVYGISLKILKNREDAEDNVQNVFYKAHRKIRSFQGASRVSTWLFRIAVNEALMQLRRRTDKEIPYSNFENNAQEQSVIPEAEDPRPDPETRCIMADLTKKAFRGCTPTITTMFVLNKAEGWTNRELGKVYGTSAQTVKSRVFRARFRLRQQILRLEPTRGTVS
jgi:RNA polymerase sigma-70 factor, ECF subfamily